MSAKFEIFKGNDQKHYFRYLGNSGSQILRSEAYEERAGAVNGINSVKANSQRDSAFQRHTNQAGRFYFNLVAGNHQIIATSNPYRNTSERTKAISDVKSHAANAPTED